MCIQNVCSYSVYMCICMHAYVTSHLCSIGISISLLRKPRLIILINLNQLIIKSITQHCVIKSGQMVLWSLLV